MTTLYCAICGERFGPDDEHVWLKAEHKLIDDLNSLDEYAMHRHCWRRLSKGWMQPA